MKKSILLIISLFLAVTVPAQDISSALRQAQARFDSGNESGGIELVNKVLAKYPDNKDAKDLLAKFNQTIKDREIDSDWKTAQTQNTFESYQQFRSKHPGSKYDDMASDTMAKKLADKFNANSTYADRTKAESYAKKSMTKDYIANKWEAAMAKKTSSTSSTTSSTSSYGSSSSSSRSYNSSSSTSSNRYGSSYGSSSSTSRYSTSTSSSSYKTKDKLVTFGVDLSVDFDVMGEGYGVSPGLLMRIGSYNKWVNGFVGLKYAHWSGNSDYSWSYDSDPYKCKVNALTIPITVNLNYLPGDLLGVCAYFGIGYEFNIAYSGVYVNPCPGSWVFQMGFGGRHWDWRFYYRMFPTPFFTTLEDGVLGTGLTYYF